MGCMITGTKRNMKATLLSVDYLKRGVKAKQPHMENKLNKLSDYTEQLDKHDHSNEMEMEWNDIATNIYTNMPNMVQLSSNMT